MFYKLDENKNPVPCTIAEYGALYREPYNENRIVGSDNHHGIRVSTVFLGADHNFHSEGEPILFETMVFSVIGDAIYQDRYTTWDKALIGHDEVLKKVMIGDIGDIE